MVYCECVLCECSHEYLLIFCVKFIGDGHRKFAYDNFNGVSNKLSDTTFKT